MTSGFLDLFSKPFKIESEYSDLYNKANVLFLIHFFIGIDAEVATVMITYA